MCRRLEIQRNMGSKGGEAPRAMTVPKSSQDVNAGCKEVSGRIREVSQGR